MIFGLVATANYSVVDAITPTTEQVAGDKCCKKQKSCDKQTETSCEKKDKTDCKKDCKKECCKKKEKKEEGSSL